MYLEILQNISTFNEMSVVISVQSAMLVLDSFIVTPLTGAGVSIKFDVCFTFNIRYLLLKCGVIRIKYTNNYKWMGPSHRLIFSPCIIAVEIHYGAQMQPSNSTPAPKYASPIWN